MIVVPNDRLISTCCNTIRPVSFVFRFRRHGQRGGIEERFDGERFRSKACNLCVDIGGQFDIIACCGNFTYQLRGFQRKTFSGNFGIPANGMAREMIRFDANAIAASTV